MVHITDVEGEDTDEVLDRARTVLEEEEFHELPEVQTNLRLSGLRYANRVGEHVINLIEGSEYDHVVMGHHGSGTLERMVLGSASETVVRGADVPVTVVP